MHPSLRWRSAWSICALAVVASSGCYASHERPSASDAGLRDAPSRDVSPVDAPAPEDAASACGIPVTATLEVPLRGCAEITLSTTAGNRCTGAHDGVERLLRLRRPAGGERWYFLIRARETTTTEIAAGLVDPEVCNCRVAASASGGDLTLHGVGGDLPNTDAVLDVIVDGQDGAMWLRACDGPPR